MMVKPKFALKSILQVQRMRAYCHRFKSQYTPSNWENTGFIFLALRNQIGYRSLRHNFSTGDSVLSRNPANHGLASTIGIVGEKVVHDNQSIVW